MDRGKVWLYRALLDHPLWRSREKFDKRSAWVDLVCQADHRTGGFYASIRFLAARWRWPRQTTYDFLKRLERDNMVQLATGDHCLLYPRSHIYLEGLTGRSTGHLIIYNYFKFQRRPDIKPDVINKDRSLPIKESFLTNTSPPQKEKLPPQQKKPPQITIDLATQLRIAILKVASLNGSKPKVPNDHKLITGRSSWANEIRLMIKSDKRTPKEIQAVIQWLIKENPKRESPFVVLSAQALRSKFDRITFQMKRSRPSPSQRPTCAGCGIVFVNRPSDKCGICEEIEKV